MSYQTFTWCPNADPEGTNAFRVLSAQFGDGFTQEVGDGINNEVQSWPLQFPGYESQITPIRDFLRAHAGFKRFFWTPPMGDKGLYICREYRLQPKGGKSFVLLATFEQRFSP